MDELGGVGGVSSIGGSFEPAGPDTKMVADAADRVGNVEAAADRVSGAAADGFEKNEEAGLTVRPREGLKNGDWLHDPRQLQPDQAEDLQKMLEDPGLHPSTKDSIREFLDDYKNKKDDLFPDHPDPMPRPYPEPNIQQT